MNKKIQLKWRRKKNLEKKKIQKKVAVEKPIDYNKTAPCGLSIVRYREE